MNYATFVAYDENGDVIAEWPNQPAHGLACEDARRLFVKATPEAASRELFED
jgi:hypothetical protein